MNGDPIAQRMARRAAEEVQRQAARQARINEHGIPMANRLALRPTDGRYDTAAVTRRRQEIVEDRALLTRAVTPALRKTIETRIINNTQQINNSLAQQVRTTRKRREAVPGDRHDLTGIDQAGDIWELSPLFAPYEGQAVTFRIAFADGRYEVYHIDNYHAAHFGVQVYYHLTVDSVQVKDGMTELTITGDNQLPRGKTYQQVFRDNETGTCVLDSLQRHLTLKFGDDVAKFPKNHKTSYNKIQKLKKRYPDGIKEDDLQVIADELQFTIDLRFMIPSLGLNRLFTATVDPRMRIVIMNVRPHHVQLFTGNFDATPILPEEFTDKISYYHHTPLYLSERHEKNIRSLITQDGIFYRDTTPFDASCFFDQFKFHLYTEPLQCDQALSWCNGEQFLSTIPPVFEYDMNQAYLNNPHHYAGYLLHEEDGFFPSTIIPELVKLYENDFSTVLVHITLQSKTMLEQMFNIPTYSIVPLWFACLLDDFYITKIEVRKAFKLDMKRVEREFNKWYTGSDDSRRKAWKMCYTKLYGQTGQFEKINDYNIHGVENADFYAYLQSKKDTYKVFQRNDDKSYHLTDTVRAKSYCPTILHSNTLYCAAELLKVAKTLPLETISSKTLDSLKLTTRIKTPTNFKEKALDKPYNPTYDFHPIRVFIEDDIVYTTPTYTPVHSVNYHLGMGGSGKTHTLLMKYPNAILVVPTKALREAKKVEYPGRMVITHHKFMGWGCKQRVPFFFTNKRNRDKKYFWYGDAIVDEITMLSPESLEEMSKAHPCSRLHFLGDLHTNGVPFQCANPMISNPVYKVRNMITYTTDYRSKDEETKAFKHKLRETLALIFESKQYHEYEGMDRIISTLTTNERDATLTILTGSRWVCDYYESLGQPSMNAFRIQGQTLSQKFQIDTTTMTLQKFYTCVSRCERISDITFIAPSNKQDDRWDFRHAFFARQGDVDEMNSGELRYEKNSDEEIYEIDC